MNLVDSASREIRKLKISAGVVASNDLVSLRTLSPDSGNGEFARDVADITVWRNIYPDAYMTAFYSTWERTRNWLSGKYRENDSDLMLMAADRHGVSFGHFSFIDFTDNDGQLACELSRVVRGPGLGPRDGIKESLRLGLTWCSRELGVHKYNLRVFSDNERAARLYSELGFEETGSSGLHKQATKDGHEWVYTDNNLAERTEVLMTLKTSED